MSKETYTVRVGVDRDIDEYTSLTWEAAMNYLKHRADTARVGQIVRERDKKVVVRYNQRGVGQ